jgi:hypothetical protein
MTLPTTISTSTAQLDGSVTGMIVTAIVAALALALLVGLTYRANSHLPVRKSSAPSPGEADSAGPGDEPPAVVPGPAEPGSAPAGTPAAPEGAPARDLEPAPSWLVGGSRRR